MCGLFILIHLRCQVISKVAHLSHTVLSREWNLFGQTQCYCLGHWCGLGEKVEVAQGKGQRNRFLKVNQSLLLLLHSSILAHSNVASADVARHRKFDSLLCCCDGC